MKMNRRGGFQLNVCTHDVPVVLLLLLIPFNFRMQVKVAMINCSLLLAGPCPYAGRGHFQGSISLIYSSLRYGNVNDPNSKLNSLTMSNKCGRIGLGDGVTSFESD